MSSECIADLQREQLRFRDGACHGDIMKELNISVFSNLSPSQDFFLKCAQRFKAENRRLGDLINYYEQSLLGLASTDLVYVAEEDDYLKTILGLIFLSGFFNKKIVLTTENEVLKFLLSSNIDSGAIHLLNSRNRLKIYEIDFHNSIFLKRNDQSPAPRQVAAKVFALTFSELHLLDGSSVETWEIDGQLSIDNVINRGRSCRIRRGSLISKIFNVPTAGYDVTGFLVTEHQIEERYVEVNNH
jgi:hypothetical protein